MGIAIRVLAVLWCVLASLAAAPAHAAKRLALSGTSGATSHCRPAERGANVAFGSCKGGDGA
jgi:hypothetical protein